MPYSKLLSAELIEADELVAKKMKVAVGSTVFKLSRVRLADEGPRSPSKRRLPIMLGFPESMHMITRTTVFFA